MGVNPYEADMAVSTETLQKFRLMLYEELDKRGLGDMKVDMSTMTSFLAERVAIRYIKEIWGQEHKGTTFEAPADWWEAFKERWAPEWFLKKYPVRMRRETISFRTMYPDFKAVLPDQRMVIRTLKNGY